ncbi:hypothetical protein QUF80_05230 [Desulfococcaceae bacterium HSG8]|nr:hypothetical protein [Desulfococcaceae bacterium HSG8]
MTENKIQNAEQNIYNENEKLLNNFLCCLTMLEKTSERLARQNYYRPGQYPEIFIEIEQAVRTVRAWIEDHRIFSGFPIFRNLLSVFVESITDQIAILIETTHPAKGKKAAGKSLRARQQEKLYNSADSMIGHLKRLPDKMKIFEEPVSHKIEEALLGSFKKDCLRKYEKHRRDSVSQRGEKTCIFPWSNPDEYDNPVADKKRFRLGVVSKSGDYVHATGHKPGCENHKKYKMRGFRALPRKTVMPGGKKKESRIRMAECADCGQRFSLLPSFLPREKHFSIDIIGQVLRDIVLFAESVSGVLENMKYLCGREIKSRQTVFNRLRRMGTHHPATLLTRAGVTGSGYFQEDGGFEKEPGLRTCTVVMVEPQTMTVWHTDCTDHADEETLTSSSEEFVRKTDFKIPGIAKDRWEPATDALKNVFHGVRTGFCHLRCLKKMSKALSAYQKETRCSDKEAGRLYKKFRKVLKTATSGGSMRAKLKSLNDEALNILCLRSGWMN